MKEHMKEVNVRSESLAAQVSTLESRVQTRETELAGSRGEMDVLKKEYQVSNNNNNIYDLYSAIYLASLAIHRR